MRAEVWSIGGTGTALRSCTRHDDQGVFEATRWVTVLYLPLVPLQRSRYRLVERRKQFPGGRTLLLESLGPVPLTPGGVARTVLLAWVGAPVALVLPTGLLGLPGVLAGRPDLAAAGAVLSSFWMIPFGLGLGLWLQGLPWPRDPPRVGPAALLGELRRSAGVTAAAVAATVVLLGGACGGVRVAVDLGAGLGPREALRGGAENAAFLVVLCALVGPVLWFSRAWRSARPNRTVP